MLFATVLLFFSKLQLHWWPPLHSRLEMNGEWKRGWTCSLHWEALRYLFFLDFCFLLIFFLPFLLSPFIERTWWERLKILPSILLSRAIFKTTKTLDFTSNAQYPLNSYNYCAFGWSASWVLFQTPAQNFKQLWKTEKNTENLLECGSKLKN